LIDKFIRNIVNLLLYGGAYIGLCAACITALTFELIGDVGQLQLSYILLIGVSTAALYSLHRVIGLPKLAHVTSFERYHVIRKYKFHIWGYGVVWLAMSIWLFIPMASINFVLWLLPGGCIAVFYVIPIFSRGRRLRDLGWIKIILIGWSWAWLTAFIPALYFGNEPLYMATFMGIGRMLFIVALTIPFEIRDISIDKSVGLTTLPVVFGMDRTLKTGVILCLLIILFVTISSFHYHDPAYGIAMSMIALLTIWISKRSIRETDDYFFSGLTDGTMIMALIIYSIVSNVI
jgi:4-hydroxybenzoate polyprenyltransferase